LLHYFDVNLIFSAASEAVTHKDYGVATQALRASNHWMSRLKPPSTTTIYDMASMFKMKSLSYW